MKRIKKPCKCCYPNCLNCPYDDCCYDVLEVEDYTESNERDYDFYEQDKGVKLHKGADEEYRKYRELAYQRRNRKYIDRHEYNQEYYKKHGEEIKAKNTIRKQTRLSVGNTEIKILSIENNMTKNITKRTKKRKKQRLGRDIIKIN